MYTERPYGGTKTRGQIMLLYKNTVYKLERERDVLVCMFKQYLSKGMKNLGDIPNLLAQNSRVDDIVVQEMYYRELLNTMDDKEA